MRFGTVVLLACVVAAPLAAEIPAGERRSDFELLSPETRAMQSDDTANPGMLAVLDGEALWNAKAGSAGKSCADCHGDATLSMRGVAARFPRWSAARAGPIDLAGQIDACRSERQGASAWPVEGPARLAATAYLAHQSRGMPISPPPDANMTAVRERGRKLFNARMGQLDLSCAACHDDNWGRRLGGTPIPQAHPVGYPIYRLEWQSVGSLQRRFRNCLNGVRAEPLAYDAPELIELEAYLMQRAAGLRLETPAVRP